MSKKKQDPELKEILCRILDAEYREELGTEDEPKYLNSVFIQIEDVNTKQQFITQLSGDDIQDLLGLDRSLSSKELIGFAKDLREREDPCRMLAPSDSAIIDPSMLKKSESLDLESTGDLSSPVIERKISKFSVKNKLKN